MDPSSPPRTDTTPTGVTAIETELASLQQAFDAFVTDLGPLLVGTPGQFPAGWRDAAQGQTVWRLVEELVVQNLTDRPDAFGLHAAREAGDDASVFDLACRTGPEVDESFVNVKCSASDPQLRRQRDIARAEDLLDFYDEHRTPLLFTVTFDLSFREEADQLFVTVDQAHLFPVAWIPDVYVHPGGGHSLRSRYFRDLRVARRRTLPEFLGVLRQELELAEAKRQGDLGGPEREGGADGDGENQMSFM